MGGEIKETVTRKKREKRGGQKNQVKETMLSGGWQSRGGSKRSPKGGIVRPEKGEAEKIRKTQHTT